MTWDEVQRVSVVSSMEDLVVETNDSAFCISFVGLYAQLTTVSQWSFSLVTVNKF